MPIDTAGTAPTSTAPTTETVVGVDPITAGEITAAQLVLMTLDLDALGDDYAGFEEVAIGPESNLELARKTLQDPSDEADDIATLGRIEGARAELRPRSLRVGAGDVVSLHSWVSLFETDAGAAAYLDDFVQDAAKGIGGGIPDDLAVTSANSFVLDDIGSQAIGLLIAESTGDGFQRFQTLVGVRIGRVLGFVAIVHPDDEDRRVRAIGLAELLAERMLGVLSGDLVPEPPPPVREPLVAYEFEYRQTIDQVTSEATILATGVDVVGEALDCRIVIDLEGLGADRRYIIVGDDAQFIDQNAPVPAYEPTSRDAFNTASDLIYCPGWPVELLASGLDVVLAGRPITEGVFDDVQVLVYQLDEAAAVAIGFVPLDSGLTVDRFEVIIDAVNPWTRSLTMEISGRAPEFAAVFGEEFAKSAGPTVSVTIEFTATAINDETLEVVAP